MDGKGIIDAVHLLVVAVIQLGFLQRAANSGLNFHFQLEIRVRYYYLDADSYLELKVEIQTTIRGALQESELYYGDYEQVNGIYYPFAVHQAQKSSASRTQVS